MKKFLLDFSLAELSAQFDKPFRAKQIYKFVYQQYGADFAQISTLPKETRAFLAENFSLDNVTIAARQTSKDGSEKFLFHLADDHTIEAVLLLMREGENDEEGEVVKEPRYTICISSQVGCKIGCAFCMTGKGGFTRNISAGEIAAQALLIKREKNMATERGLNIVFMGMGEPLDNFENVAKAIGILTDKEGLNIAPRRITISTSGITPKIDALAALNSGVLLAISLHAVDNETRTRLIPLNKAYDIESVIAAVRRFPIDLRKRVLFEYLMIGSLNDTTQHAKKLVKLLSGIPAKVNLIAFNPHEGSEFARPKRADMETFQRYLLDRGVVCTIRESRGVDIDAACGQLRERFFLARLI
ncbi:MAG: 23S rRNA (adenine(2503)-C(2))-methyltransferase RlmN [Helicobacteraceae bacterium]|jgi:23S rRNA (adenine2503-C2)-methyltransferase|nr:23S rRNA (adenine(2503)-C(2))-methyltransferase RlmN [Helicobacteraceae bacterium]